MPDVDSSWIKPGVEVVVYSTGVRPNPRRSTVLKVATQSFTLEGISERIKLATLRSRSIGGTWDSWEYAVVRPDSDKATELLQTQQRDRVRYAARKAVEDWNTGASRDDPAKLDAAIRALEAYRSALGVQEGSNHE